MRLEYDVRVMHGSPVRLLLTWFACLVAGTVPASAQVQAVVSEPTEIAVCTQEWKGDTNADGSGVYWDIFHAVFEPVGVKIIAAYMPYKISVVRVKAKACDIAMGGYLDEFSDVLYPDWPHEAESVLVLHPKNLKYNDARSLKGKKSAWLEGYGFQRYLPTGIDFVEVRNEVKGLWMLDRGRIDYFVDYEATIQETATEIGFDLSRFTLSPVTELSKLIYPMFRDDDRGATLVKLYNRRMAELHENGTLDRIFEKHQIGPYPSP